METIVEGVCGLDVDKAGVVACVLKGPPRGKALKEIRRFESSRSGLQELNTWIKLHGVTQAVMESTGAYWVPVYEVLEECGGLDLLVVNANHVKKVPGRKTDVSDAQWLAQLARAGLLNRSFVPPSDIRELRELVRTRRDLVHAQTSERNQITELLVTAQIRLDCVATDIFGMTGLAILRCLARGETDREKMASLACGKLRQKMDELAKSLDGRITENRRFVLDLRLRGLDQIAARIAEVDGRIEQYLAPYQPLVEKLCEVPGISRLVAAAFLAEVGVRVKETFGSADRLASWGGLSPGNNKSAGKRLGGRGSRMCKGNEYLRTVLVEAALAAVKKKGSFLKAKYHRLKGRIGSGKKAVCAIAHKLLRIAYVLMSTDARYRDLGEGYLDTVQKLRTANRLVERLRTLGYTVTATPTTALDAAAG